MTDYVQELAEELCRRAQARRLQRIGEYVPENSVPFDQLPEVDQANWRLLAEVVLERDSDLPPTLNLRRKCDDYDRYTRVLHHDREWQNQMRRAMVIEMRVEVDKLWEQSQ